MQDWVLLYVKSPATPDIVGDVVRIVAATITSTIERTSAAVRTAPAEPVVARP